MKQYIIQISLFITISLLCFSCENTDRTLLLKAEELIITQNKDSALLLLESIDFPEEMSERDYAKYCQLIVFAHKRNRIAIKDDTIIHHAVNYYKDKPSDQLEYLKSLLLLGNVYEEQDSILLAEKCFLEVHNLSKQVNDTMFYGLSAFELGGSHKYRGKYDKSIEWFGIATETFRKNESTIMQLRSMRQAADCYVLSGKPDTALTIYQDVLNQISDGRTKIKADVYKNIAITYKNTGHYQEALYFIRKSIETTPKGSPYPIQYIVLASIQEEMGRKDSSIYYNRLALKYAQKQNDLDVIYRAYEELLNDVYPETFDNYLLSRAISDSIYQKQKYESIKYQRLYNIEKIKQNNKELKIGRQRYVFLSLFIFICLITFYLFYLNTRNRKRAEFKQALDEQNNIILAIRDSVSQRLFFYKKMVRLSISPNKSKHKSFLTEYNKIMFEREGEFSHDWAITEELSNSIFDNYSIKIEKFSPDINESERKIIILMKLGFTVSEISSIFDKSIHTIYRHCSNIRKKMNIPETESITDFFDKIL